MQKVVFIATGSNIGDRGGNLAKATQKIAVEIGDIKGFSKVYETAAWGGVEQQDYYNQVLKINTRHLAEDVLQKCLQIESQMGRERKERWGARNIDIDVLFYENKILETKKLTLPHPRLHLRKFVLKPICELQADWVHPVLNKNMKQLLEECKDDLEAKIIEER